jgi:hypothetical protein
MEEPEDSAWKDLLAITKALVAFGCIAPTSDFKRDCSNEDLEDMTLKVTPAGADVGLLSFDNSLWCYLAMGGTYDVINASGEFDEMKDAMQIFNDTDEENDPFVDINEETNDDSEADVPSRAQQEAENLLYYLQELSPAEMAGYVSCFVGGDTGRNNRLDSIGVFKRLGPRLQRSIQVLLDVTERFTDVQRQLLVDEKTCNCQFDLSHCEVVTAWANGCTWDEALAMSEVAPGDLVRIIGRATDAVRQFAALPFYAVRKTDLDPSGMGGVDPLSRGIHPEVRRLCREAAIEMNRYPVKDPFPFDTKEDEILSEDDSEDDYGDGDGEERDDPDDDANLVDIDLAMDNDVW